MSGHHLQTVLDVSLFVTRVLWAHMLLLLLLSLLLSSRVLAGGGLW